jgi:hypothetical protein
MSLEEVIKEQTAAIKEQTLVLQKLVTAIAVNVAGKKDQIALLNYADGDAEPTNFIPATGATDIILVEADDQRYAVTEGPTTVPAEAPRAKKAKAAPKSEELQMMEEVIAAEELPSGERNDAYYVANIQPICLELVAKNKPALVAIVTEHFGAKSAKLIPSDKWDELVTLVKAEL